MDKDIRKYLIDIEMAIARIEIHLKDCSGFAAYQTNITVKSAVEREIGIIGEAISRILKLNPDIQISFARIIVGLRNRIIHSYDSLNDAMIWKIVVRDIPVLTTEVKALLNK